jgi:cobyrinic acid a,c-diamide synthase
MGHGTVKTPRLVVAGTSSGVGKTTFTVGLIRALRSRGLKVAAFKCGPDYLDPTYHARAAGTTSHNLDGWMMGEDAVKRTFARVSKYADIAVIEGVMGLYDGASVHGDEGSTAEIAKWLKAPVLLLVDASGMARTIGAIAHGFAGFDPQLNLAGIIGNCVGSRGHLELLRDALITPPLLGGMPKNDAGEFPQRHLGLLTASQDSISENVLAQWGEIVRDWCALDSILSVAREAPGLNLSAELPPATRNWRCRIGVALDEAFHFYYDDNLRRLENADAELIYFSPIHDPHLPVIDGLYLGGGYPEVYAAQLAGNGSMRREIQGFARDGGIIYAECGGLMYLCSSLRTLDDVVHPMCDVLPGRTTMCERLQALGYVEVETVHDSVLGPAGARFRGHQFRYSNVEIEESRVTPAYTAVRRSGGSSFAEGYQIRRVLASYVHAHWASNPAIPVALVDACCHKQSNTI